MSITKKLQGKIGKGVAALSLIASAAGCASSGNLIEGQARNFNFRDRTQAEIPYSAELAVIFGRGFYVQKKENVGEDELPHAYIPSEKTNTRSGVTTGVTRFESREQYIPRKVLAREYTEDEWADGLVLRTTYSPETGVEGVRARVTSPEELRRRAGAPRNSQGYSVVTTQDDRAYDVRTMEIFDGETFFPHVSVDEMDRPGRLNFYEVPAREGTDVIGRPDGTIVIESPNGIYRPELAGLREAMAGKHIGEDLWPNGEGACDDCVYEQEGLKLDTWTREDSQGNKIHLNRNKGRQVERAIVKRLLKERQPTVVHGSPSQVTRVIGN